MYIHTHTHTYTNKHTHTHRFPLALNQTDTLSLVHMHTHSLRKYRFPSLFAVDTYFLFWTILKPRIKRTNINLKLKDRLFQKSSFGPRISEIADKKAENNENQLYFIFYPTLSFPFSLLVRLWSNECIIIPGMKIKRLLNNLSWKAKHSILFPSKIMKQNLWCRK